MSRNSVISLFSGAMGLDLGLEAAGFEIRAAVECDAQAVETIRKNKGERRLELLAEKIEGLTTERILNTAKLKAKDITLVAGGPSCQSFSTAGQRGSLSDPRGSIFDEYVRVVREIRPRFFLMENVKGILSAAVKHRPLRERGPEFPPLSDDETLGSAFWYVLAELKKLNYVIYFDVLNAADYGVPQSRERVFIVGSRDREAFVFPTATHDRFAKDGLPKWNSLKSVLTGLNERKPEFEQISAARQKFLEQIPAGGNWRDLPEKLQAEAIGGAYYSWGGRTGFLRRLAWDKPSPALTTNPAGKATFMCHPNKLRPLSIRECGRIQQFPDGWEFAGSLRQKYEQIGNAVPVGLAQSVGEAIQAAMKSRKRTGELGTVVCTNEGLLRRMLDRPDTILNPWVEKESNGQAREWIEMSGGQRRRFVEEVLGASRLKLAVFKATT